MLLRQQKCPGTEPLASFHKESSATTSAPELNAMAKSSSSFCAPGVPFALSLRGEPILILENIHRLNASERDAKTSKTAVKLHCADSQSRHHFCLIS